MDNNMDGLDNSLVNHNGLSTSLDDTTSTHSDIGTDGLIDHDNHELRDRVGMLEKKVLSQENELICLKSALANCLARLKEFEEERVSMPPMPVHKSSTPRRSYQPKKDVTPRRAVSSQDINKGHMTKRDPYPRSPHNGSLVKPSHNGPITASRSMISLHQGSLSIMRRSTPSLDIVPKVSPKRVKEPTFNPDDGCLRFFLRGRPITMYAPTQVGEYEVTKSAKPPSEKLKLEWVYGYRGKDCRSNIYLLPTGEIVYFVAAVVVLYNADEKMQRHYLGHNDDVKCLAVHPDQVKIATGQVAGHDKREGRNKPWMPNYTPGKKFVNPAQPHVRIWDSVTLHTLHVIGLGDFERAVACIGFSKVDGGQYFCAIDEANEHIISLWDWQKGQKITETKSSTEQVTGVEFHPMDKNVIITCGRNQVSFWNMEGGTLTKKMGIFERHEKPKFVSCIAFADNGDVITGDTNGNILVWGRGNNRVAKSVVGAHPDSILSLCVMNNETILSGGKDHKIIEWNFDYDKTGVEHELPEEYGPIRMISKGKGNMVLVGTTRNVILQGTLGLRFNAIVWGHVDELWGLSTHPNQNQFISCGYDKNLTMWDALSHSTIWTHTLPDEGHCVSFHPSGNCVVVGLQNSHWLAVDLSTRESSDHTDGNEQIECVEFSPDGNSLALGSRDNFIYVYQVSENGAKYSRMGRCSGHSSFVTHLDWSADSQNLRSNSGDHELLFWNATTCRQVTAAASLKDVEWASENCTLGFNVCGIWPEGADGTDVNGCTRAHQKAIMASADDFGKVNLYPYPCCQPKSTPHSYGGHSSHVTNVKFLHTDSRLLSTGGKDMAVLQWEVI